MISFQPSIQVPIIFLLSGLISKAHAFVSILSAGTYNDQEKLLSRIAPWKRAPSPQEPSFNGGLALGGNGSIELSKHDAKRRSFIFSAPAVLLLPQPARPIDDASQLDENAAFHSAAYGREEYTNSIVASRDTNISPKEVYDTIASDYLKEAFDAAMKNRGGDYVPRALDVGAGAGVSTEVLYRVGYHTIDALDWSGAAWNENVVENPKGHCPSSVSFYELDDERFLDKWRKDPNRGDRLYDVIVFNFAVNESKATLFAKELLDKQHGRLLAPINTSDDYWLKQTYKVVDGKGNLIWSATDVGAWSVQFQPDVTQDTCSGIWCAPFNGFQKKRSY